MSEYRKLIAAVVGLAVMIAARFGFEVDSATTAAIIDAIVGLATAVSVYLVPNEPSKGANTLSPPTVGLLALLLACLAMAGCSGTRAAYKAADGLTDTAYVIAEQYAASVTELNDLADQGILRGEALRDAQDVVRRTRVVMASLTGAVLAYDQTQSAETEEALAAAINQAAIAIADLINAVKAATDRSAAVIEPLPAAA